ncbi:histone H1-like protein [Cinnamomum micranthum f. kanehirae]|uniref:Histone H1-like protein n=1 Tax=Cinnamomum micranthum f. kanehirae TaxID=337451 RepID=A0A3S3R496_9MAGN|nr:histone H1-like protein [Cinnamomum micranthum f. kanehirae]
MAKANMTAAVKPKPTPENKPKPKPTKLPSSLHPPYLKMISEAISSLKERTGSSQQAIAKFIEEKYKTDLPQLSRRFYPSS